MFRIDLIAWKLNAVLVHATTNARKHWYSWVFHGSKDQIKPFNKPVAPIKQQFCDIRGCRWKALLCTHMCKRSLALSLPQACSNHYTWKSEDIFCAITLLGRCLSFLFSATNPFSIILNYFPIYAFQIKYVSHLGLYPRNVVSANSSRKIDRREPVLNLRTQNKAKHINFETTWWLRVWDKNYKLTAR